MNNNKEEMRELAALFYSVVLSVVSENEFKTSVQQLIKTAKDNHVTIVILVCLLFCIILIKHSHSKVCS